ncbi:MAG: DASS family sodium-coupled anion symporter [Clostridia bacterium]|nr:DASS family sodium-coupled anion symporter [Clostridia bacterium]
MNKNGWWKLFLVIVVPIAIWFSPTPSGLEVKAWHMFAIYAGAMLGIILRPFPEPVIVLLAVAVAGLLFNSPKLALAGFGNSTVWLVFSAFLLSQAFIDTGLGKRISYVLLKYFGKSTLGVGYVAAVTDLIISPATPSNTARSGGVVYPIFRSLAATLGSEPGPTGRKIGSYLTILMYQISLTTGTLFLTAMAPNALVASFAAKILHVDLNWGVWAMAAAVPGLLILFALPWLVYKVYPPEIRQVSDSARIAQSGLAELGAMKWQEMALAVLFILAIVAWATTQVTGIDATMIAVAFVALCLVLGVTKWDSVLTSGGAWSTLIWYGGIVGLASALSDAKFFEWLADVLGRSLGLAGWNHVLVLLFLLVLSLVVRYLFASTAAYVASFIPVLYSMALSANVSPMVAALLIAFSSGFGSLLTHYGGALGPVLFGTGYVDQATWWKIGIIVVAFSSLVYLVIGMPYWRLVGLW